jgi:enolase
VRNRRRISRVSAREVFDSRGRPTIEVAVELASGHAGRAIAPAGASVGRHEAVELRDGDQARFGGRGVLRAVAAVHETIAPALVGLDPAEQARVDALLVELDGTSDRSRLGGNALIATSLAVCRAACTAAGVPLWRALGGSPLLPRPMVNALSGGLHARRGLECQDFMLVPVGAGTYSIALEQVARVLDATRALLEERGSSTLKADEGGFGPVLPSDEDALDLLVDAIERAGLEVGDDVAIAVDVAASHLFDEARDARDFAERVVSWLDRYPIVSLEDPLVEDDWEGWRLLTERTGGRVQLVGDDLFATNLQRLERGVEERVANAVLVKPNQAGTLTETLDVLEAARAGGYAAVVSARSGDTEDTFIADLAVGTGAGQIKIGSLAQSERLAKYNQLLRIEDELGAGARFAPARA